MLRERLGLLAGADVEIDDAGDHLVGIGGRDDDDKIERARALMSELEPEPAETVEVAQVARALKPKPKASKPAPKAKAKKPAAKAKAKKPAAKAKAKKPAARAKAKKPAAKAKPKKPAAKRRR